MAAVLSINGQVSFNHKAVQAVGVAIMSLFRF